MASTIDNLTGFADQLSVLQLPDGTVANMELIFNGTTERWTMNIVYGNFVCSGIGVCCYPNVLRQWRNILPFGIACTTSDQTDPFNINDFASGRALLYILSAADVQAVEIQIFGGPQI